MKYRESGMPEQAYWETLFDIEGKCIRSEDRTLFEECVCAEWDHAVAVSTVSPMSRHSGMPNSRRLALNPRLASNSTAVSDCTQ